MVKKARYLKKIPPFSNGSGIFMRNFVGSITAFAEFLDKKCTEFYEHPLNNVSKKTKLAPTRWNFAIDIIRSFLKKKQ